jgi:hypothetical protein
MLGCDPRDSFSQQVFSVVADACYEIRGLRGVILIR